MSRHDFIYTFYKVSSRGMQLCMYTPRGRGFGLWHVKIRFTYTYMYIYIDIYIYKVSSTIIVYCTFENAMCTAGTRVWAVACQDTILHTYSIKSTLHLLYIYFKGPGKAGFACVISRYGYIYTYSIKSALQLLYIVCTSLEKLVFGCGTSIFVFTYIR